MGLLHHPFWLLLDLTLFVITFQLLNYFVWLRITDEGSLPEMRLWSILLIKSCLKWCIYLSRSLLAYLMNLHMCLANESPSGCSILIKEFSLNCFSNTLLKIIKGAKV